MKKDLENYAEIILFECLKLKKEEPLFIQAPLERYDFVRIVCNKAYEYGIKDIHLRLIDEYIKHDKLKNLSYEELIKDDYFRANKLSEYASKHAAVLSLVAEYPGLMDDIDPKKTNAISKLMAEDAKTYYDMVNKNELAWCIAAVPSNDWANKMFNNEVDALDKLWRIILDMCLITTKDPKKTLNDKIKISHERASKINNLNLEYLKYTNSLGTNLTIRLPENYRFHNIEMKIKDNRIIYPNIPSEEIYSSPNKYYTNGIVYSSKPLIYRGKFIDDFFLEFKDGKVINYDAKVGKEELKNIITFDESACYLGEVALVAYDSPISNTHKLFYTTLFDENASCHLALGQSFSDSVANGEYKEIKELESLGLNQSKIHVDFMVGTSDLNIVGITKDKKEIPIFTNGNFSI